MPVIAERGAETEREGRPCAWYRGGQDGHLAGGSGARAGSEREMRLSFAISLPASALVSVPIFPSRSLFLSLSVRPSWPCSTSPHLCPHSVSLCLPLCPYLLASVSLSVLLSLRISVSPSACILQSILLSLLLPPCPCPPYPSPCLFLPGSVALSAPWCLRVRRSLPRSWRVSLPISPLDLLFL